MQMNSSDLSFAQIQALTEGTWAVAPPNPNETLWGAGFDTRKLHEEQIFFALSLGGGDGHAYLHHLKGSKVRLAIIERPVPPVAGIAYLQVSDSLKALHQIAHWKAQSFQGKIIALTGSCGKTTTKTWMLHLLSAQYSVQANPGSFNNHIGCPITLLSLKPQTEILILEMGTSGTGELELLSRIAPADVTLLLNVGHAHLGKFGSPEALLEAKMEIFLHQRLGARSVIPSFDRRVASKMAGDYLTYGPNTAFRWESLGQDGNQGTQKLRLFSPKGAEEVEVPHLGAYVPELLSAILAVFYALGIELKNLPQRVATLPQEKGRSTLLSGTKGERVLDDSYNANPESLVNMMTTLTQLEGDCFVACVGNLAEMDENLLLSGEVIINGIPRGLTHLLMCGSTAQSLSPLIQSIHPSLNVQTFDEPLAMLEALEPLRKPGTNIGVKGSRSAHMERLVLALTGALVRCPLERCGLLQNCSTCPKLGG
ncbi:MAG: hypothetical protein A2600_10135 [Candidatus Lambdaproteobacteria bacterium RIFOXYD1_FULL_56_27]|uniref:Uncharacterized protein n=1 Tax=Candidatus Lambdaproteobacteria bacterium RIFOXYD2_FULL_56_26 TaxID=1817773 RepID=A0A1F6H1T1_9PROT|nr:MAG: hypothetical protein A2426_12325 [Candidatus Lambdaproteobacteria bacterium RIFOXYC1_FULL_56_13]OGH04348.1 MAG: hypothetical protein A2557_10905 [Candidatus Lambdaproteobacteria bacterium RIFOXYD2_FULL_56_26]OGH08677.1 MAG: hypothetical protein A2600_10135 [Candidatus Lambdaproteobacteria bacterium RIFOXYD1_FULL_56_27]